MDWPRDRHELYRVRGCRRRLRRCDHLRIAAWHPCAEACARLAECQGAGEAPQSCTNGCDDSHVREPIETALLVSCVLAADECQPAPDILSVAECMENPEAAGLACLNFCRAETDCNPGADLSECLTRCVSGFGDATVRYAQAEACLAWLLRRRVRGYSGPYSDEPEIDCVAYCDQLSACRIERADCVAGCQANPDVATIGCVADAVRTSQQCTGVATCENVVAPEASEACQQYCQSQRDCDRSVDLYLCQDDCTPDPEFLSVRNACIGASGCDLAACMELDGALNDDCNNVCATAVACGVFEDGASCAETCTGQAAALEREKTTYST